LELIVIETELEMQGIKWRVRSVFRNDQP